MADEDQIEGRNPVIEALRAGRAINVIYLARQSPSGSLRAVVSLAAENGVPVQTVDRERLDRMATTRAHQGVIALASPKQYADVDDLLELAAGRGEDPFLLLLDGIQDPQNLGSLLRTAEAAGVHGVVLPYRRSAGLTAAVGRASAGALEHVAVARVTNLSRTVEALKGKGLWIVAADQAGPSIYDRISLRGPIAVVIGGEGKGIGPNLRSHCDLVVRLPMRGRLSSLNAAVAGAILLYEVVRQRGPEVE